MKKIVLIMMTLMAVNAPIKASTEHNWLNIPEGEVKCLALNIYFETMAVSMADAYAVSDVVLNRADSPYFPNTACEVIKEGPVRPSWKDENVMIPRRNLCQFSWYCDGKSDEPRNSEAWSRSVKFAHDIYEFDQFRGITEGSTHYHADYVAPYWAPTLDRVTQIGAHIFYRMK
jgi:spore germination cell wall hydrolase CwlJ-like protein